MYLLDTNIVSELRKVRQGKANLRVVKWIEKVDAGALYISVITLQELEIGVLLAERKDPAQGALLRTWLTHHVMTAFSGRILNVDAAVAQLSAQFHVPNPHSIRDGLIAATALVHHMTVVTRNVADFASTGVAIVNPFH